MSSSSSSSSSSSTREKKPSKFFINDHPDILIEVLQRLDDRSLSVAACVCRLWCSISRNDSLWESLCFSNVSPRPSDVRPVVLALGGYRRLYMVCLRPVLRRLSKLSLQHQLSGGNGGGESRSVWTRDEVQLSLSLFSIDYYERLGSSNSSSTTTTAATATATASGRHGEASSSSLMFLCKPVNVS